MIFAVTPPDEHLPFAVAQCLRGGGKKAFHSPVPDMAGEGRESADQSQKCRFRVLARTESRKSPHRRVPDTQRPRRWWRTSFCKRQTPVLSHRVPSSNRDWNPKSRWKRRRPNHWCPSGRRRGSSGQQGSRSSDGRPASANPTSAPMSRPRTAPDQVRADGEGCRVHTTAVVIDRAVSRIHALTQGRDPVVQQTAGDRPGLRGVAVARCRRSHRSSGSKRCPCRRSPSRCICSRRPR